MPDIGWILFLLAAWMLGHSIYTRLVGSGLHWMPFSEQANIKVPMLSTEGLRFIFRQITSFWLGVVLLSMLHYALSYLLIMMTGYTAAGLPAMTAVSLVVIPLAMLISAVLRRSRRLTAEDDYRPVRHEYALFKRTAITWTTAVYFLLLLLYSFWLFYSTFHADGQLIQAGATVHSDLGPHTAMVSSFARGQNIPTDYQHFAGDGIRYHFFFYYFCGLLNQLGLGYVAALNLPSVLALFSMFLLIGMFAYRITGRGYAAMLAPLLTIFRSSWAGFTDLADKAKTFGWFSRDFFSAAWHQMTFIGNTPRDEWGLWTVNVYANQRHLALGISLLLIVLLLALPDIERGVGALPLARGQKFPVWWELTRKKAIWLSAGRKDKKRQLLVAVFLVLMPYWHGSMTLAALLVLSLFALFAASRLVYLLIALATVASTLLTAAFFAPGGSTLGFFAFEFGFLAEPPTAVGAVRYLVEMTGPLLPLIIVSFIIARWRTKLYLAAASVPLLFAFFFRLTPDLTVNHKFVQITIILWNVIAAESLVRLFFAKKRAPLAKAAAILLVVLLTFSGVYEHRIYHTINRTVEVSLHADSEINAWIEKNTGPRDIFITGPYSYHTFFLTGRPVWYGHPYYAWSAGHDTGAREADLKNVLAAKDPAVLDAYAKAHNIAYLLVDQALREAYPSFNEARLTAPFEQVARFGDWQQTVIYRLQAAP